MITEMEKRKYTLRKRAEQVDETRQRIVEATMALHEEVGPRYASISAIAERAGVQRLTVYRHFEDETALFQACTSCWLERHPPPAPPSVSASTAPADVTRAALQALYTYYAGTRRMWEVSYRDVDLVPALHGPMQQVAHYLQAYRDALMASWTVPRGSRQALQATLELAVRFSTWVALADAGLAEKDMAAVVTQWTEAVASSR
jgi:AcrR family transcriptional regulator